ncbi:MAG TPA: ABC transporter substrate-binding protein [Candidatus Fimadaptatus faecigallinarum]|uniref:ABC transporter substrate-binding protein n=1 Tax=Candidatus Fimadaptatus faecigallinarum TaxID=2840814 RepID=A0A9D1LSV3_9FIRM|nr:ABC transporter substrate-binding protein [Candidatus Fimadaptatus faecigallinarum]
MKRIVALVLAAMLLLAMPIIGSADSETIRIGGLAPLTGNVAVYGVATQRGVDLYVEQINAAGGVLGKQVEMVWYDEKGDAAEAVNAYNRLVGDVVALIGDVTSKPTIAVAELAALDNMPMISATATAYDVTTPGENIFRACFLDPYQGNTMAVYATQKLGKKNAAVIYNIADDYSTGLAESFKSKFEELGGTVVAYEAYGASDIDFKSQLTNIASKNPDVIFMPDYYNIVAMIAKQAREAGLDMTFLGADGWDGLLTVVDDPSILDGCYFCNHYSTDDPDENVQNFLASYTEKYNETPVSFSALGYDAAKILFTAIENAGSTDAQAIVDAMAATDIDGVTGHIIYDEHRDPQKDVAMITFEGGEMKLVEKFNPELETETAAE